MVNQQKADSLATYLGFKEYAAHVPVGRLSDIYITCDGVGTKLYLADHFQKWDTIGIDLVAMCVNDLLAVGATPRAFMDYYAVENLNFEKSKKILEGIVKGCEIAECELVGGETAQLEGMFKNPESFDLCGFALGEVVQKTRIHSLMQLPQPGDYIVGIPSSGLHSNGFTEIRKRVPLEKWMLEPTRIYTKEILSNLHKIKKCAHVTGGGLTRALSRLLPVERGKVTYSAELNEQVIEEYSYVLFDKEGLPFSPPKNIFNCGWGMLLVTDTLDLNIDDARLIGVVK